MFNGRSARKCPPGVTWLAITPAGGGIGQPSLGHKIQGAPGPSLPMNRLAKCCQPTTAVSQTKSRVVKWKRLGSITTVCKPDQSQCAGNEYHHSEPCGKAGDSVPAPDSANRKQPCQRKSHQPNRRGPRRPIHERRGTGSGGQHQGQIAIK